VKVIIGVLLIGIVVSLGNAMFHMTSGPEASAKTVRALTVRISLSLVLFALLMLSYYLGIISPNDFSH